MDARPGGSGLPKVLSSTPPNVPSTADDRPGSETDGLADIDAELAALADLTIAEHVQVFAGIHRRLTSALEASRVPAAGGVPAASHGGPGQPFQQPSR